jgi:hypothetical protein
VARVAAHLSELDVFRKLNQITVFRRGEKLGLEVLSEHLSLCLDAEVDIAPRPPVRLLEPGRPRASAAPREADFRNEVTTPHLADHLTE